MYKRQIENTATGFIGGFTGHFIEDVLTSEAISTNFVTVDQDTRINVKIKADEETEINGCLLYTSQGIGESQEEAT